MFQATESGMPPVAIAAALPARGRRPWRRRLAETLFSLAFAQVLLLAPFDGRLPAASGPGQWLEAAADRAESLYRRTSALLGDVRLVYTLASGQPLAVAASLERTAPAVAAEHGAAASQPVATMVCEQASASPAGPASQARRAPLAEQVLLAAAVRPEFAGLPAAAPASVPAMDTLDPQRISEQLRAAQMQLVKLSYVFTTEQEAAATAAEAEHIRWRARALLKKIFASGFNPAEESSSVHRPGPRPGPRVFEIRRG